MPEKVESWKCTICRSAFKTWDEAKSCEDLGEPKGKPKYKPGDRFGRDGLYTVVIEAVSLRSGPGGYRAHKLGYIVERGEGEARQQYGRRWVSEEALTRRGKYSG